MLFIFCNFILFNVKFFSNFFFWLGWLNFDVKIIFLNILLIWFTLKIIFYINLYTFTGFSFLWIFMATIYLFFLQLDAYACFLLLSESVVIFFVFSMLLHLNVNNLKHRNSKISFTILFFCFLVGFFINSNTATYFNYFISWYTTQISHYNDLLAQYLFLYTNGIILILIGFFLLIITFVLVLLVISSFSVDLKKTQNETKKVFYVRKSQNMWKQWFTKPFSRFFSKKI